MKRTLDLLHSKLIPSITKYRELKSFSGDLMKRDERATIIMSEFFTSNHTNPSNQETNQIIEEEVNSLSRKARKYMNRKEYDKPIGLIYSPETKVKDIIGLLIFSPFGIPEYIHPIDGNPIVQFVGASKSADIVDSRYAFHLLPFNYVDTSPAHYPYSTLTGSEDDLLHVLYASSDSIIDLLTSFNPKDNNPIRERLDSELGNYGVVAGDLPVLRQSYKISTTDEAISFIIYPILKNEYSLSDTYFS